MPTATEFEEIGFLKKCTSRRGFQGGLPAWLRKSATSYEDFGVLVANPCYHRDKLEGEPASQDADAKQHRWKTNVDV